MGMLATVINALALQDSLEARGVTRGGHGAIAMPAVCETCNRRDALTHLEAGRVVMLAGGTGSPFFTTDTCAALRACELGADVLLKATKVDGVFDRDPMTDPAARSYDTLDLPEGPGRPAGRDGPDGHLAVHGGEHPHRGLQALRCGQPGRRRRRKAHRDDRFAVNQPRRAMSTDDILLEVEEKMESAVEYLRKEFRGIRTGRASAGLVDHIKVDYYGSPTDLRQLATIATPDATLIVIKPFDPASLKDIEKAILASNIGITPSNDGKLIRLAVPPLSTERRQQLAGQLKKISEAARVTLRNVRRDGNKEIDRQEKASQLTEDEAKHAKDEVQKLTDTYEQKVSEVLAAKTQEVQEG